MKEFVTIKHNAKTEIIEKKSKFIANIFYVENMEEIQKNIKNVRKEYYDARHNCVAYRVLDEGNLIERFSDDGEPSGTAGAPMLDILQKKQLLNVLIIVTRYFGGILLGTGGLVRAYTESLLNAIEATELVKKEIGEEMQITLSYSEFENFKYYCKTNNVKILEIKYFEDITCNIELSDEKMSKLLKDFETKKVNLMKMQEIGKKYIEKSD